MSKAQVFMDILWPSISLLSFYYLNTSLVNIFIFSHFNSSLKQIFINSSFFPHRVKDLFISMHLLDLLSFLYKVHVGVKYLVEICNRCFRSSLGIPGWGLGRLLTPPVVYNQEEEVYTQEEEGLEEEEAKMVLKEKDQNEGEAQEQEEAKTVKYEEKVAGGEDESAGGDKVTRSQEVLEDDVLTWWNEALASQDSVLTVLELGGDEEQAVGTLVESVEVKLGPKEQGQGNLSHMCLNGGVQVEEETTQRREDSQTPTQETVLREETDQTGQEREIWEDAPKGPIPDSWDTRGVTDSQLLAMLASKHCYQCTSTSTLDWTDYEEEGEEEYNEEDYEEEVGEVVSASLQIPMYSPVRVRTVVQFGSKEERNAPLSPLTLLSRRLAQRLKGSRCTISPPPTPDLSTLEATWLHAVATQTSCTSSTATLRSPVPPMRQQLSPRASTHFYTAPSTPILVTPVPHRRMEEEEETRRREEEVSQRAEEVRKRKLKKVLAKEEKERQMQARRRTEREEAEEAHKLEEQWRGVQCSPCTKCKGKQTKGKGKQKVRKKDVQEDKEEEKKPVIRNIFFGCFKTPPCMA